MKRQMIPRKTVVEIMEALLLEDSVPEERISIALSRARAALNKQVTIDDIPQQLKDSVCSSFERNDPLAPLEFIVTYPQITPESMMNCQCNNCRRGLSKFAVFHFNTLYKND